MVPKYFIIHILHEHVHTRHSASLSALSWHLVKCICQGWVMDRLLALCNKDEILKIRRLLWTRPSLPLRKLFLFYVPFLSALRYVNVDTLRAVLASTNVAHDRFGLFTESAH